MPSDFDAWPDEPEETDPEDRWGDPESEMVRVPSVQVPGTDEDGEDQPVEIDRELATTFWAVVVLVNVGVAGLSIGAMFVYFRGNYALGGAAAVVGALALTRAYYSYRGYRAERGESTHGSEREDDGERDDDGQRDAEDGDDTATAPAER